MWLRALTVGLALFCALSVSAHVTPRLRKYRRKSSRRVYRARVVLWMYGYHTTWTFMSSHEYKPKCMWRKVFVVLFSSILGTLVCFMCNLLLWTLLLESVWWCAKECFSNITFGFFWLPLMRLHVCCNQSCDCSTGGVPKLAWLEQAQKSHVTVTTATKCVLACQPVFSLCFQSKAKLSIISIILGFPKIRVGWRVETLSMPLQRYRKSQHLLWALSRSVPLHKPGCELPLVHADV